MGKIPTLILVAMALCGSLAVASANPDAEPQQKTQQANVPTEKALADAGSDRQGIRVVTVTDVHMEICGIQRSQRRERQGGGNIEWVCF